MEEYIKKLEEANNALMERLDWQTKLRERNIEKKNLWYSVHIYKIDLKDIIDVYHGKSEGMHPLNIYYMQDLDACRSVVISRLYMNKTDDIGKGVNWSIIPSSRKNEKTMRGWITNCKRYPAWGGNYLKHYPKNIFLWNKTHPNVNYRESGVTESYFATYEEYATFVCDKENIK